MGWNARDAAASCKSIPALPKNCQRLPFTAIFGLISRTTVRIVPLFARCGHAGQPGPRAENRERGQSETRRILAIAHRLASRRETNEIKMALQAPIGGSINARGNSSRWTHDLANTRLAIRRGGSSARENGALALLRSAISRQFDGLQLAQSRGSVVPGAHRAPIRRQSRASHPGFDACGDQFLKPTMLGEAEVT